MKFVLGNSKMIAITGASGFIGSYVSNRIPYPQKRLTRKAIEKDAESVKHVWVQGDLTNRRDVQHFIQDCSTLIHLACTTVPRSSNLDMGQDIQENLISTVRLFETFAKSNPSGHIIFSSSGGNMYSAMQKGNLHTEESLPQPQSSYGINKLAAENYLRLLCKMYGIKGTVLRISNPYGVLLPKQRIQGLIGVVFAKLLANEPIDIFDSPESVRDYIHLNDLTKAFELAILHPPSEGECRIFNVSSCVGHTISEVLTLIEEVTGQKINKRYPLEVLPTASWSVLGYQKIKQALGWAPRISLQDGLRNMWLEIQSANHTKTGAH